MNQDDIKREAKEIMDKFMEAMADVELEDNFELVRDRCYREEGEGVELDENFKQRFLANARKTSGDAIVANKGDWA